MNRMHSFRLSGLLYKNNFFLFTETDQIKLYSWSFVNRIFFSHSVYILWKKRGKGKKIDVINVRENKIYIRFYFANKENIRLVMYVKTSR